MHTRILPRSIALLCLSLIFAGFAAASTFDRCDDLALSYKDNEKLLQVSTVREHALGEIINTMENGKATKDDLQEELGSVKLRIKTAKAKIEGGDHSAETAADLKSLETSQEMLELRVAPNFNANTFYDQPKYHELELTLSKLKGTVTELTKKREELRTTMSVNKCPLPKDEVDSGSDISTDIDDKEAPKGPGDLTGTWTAPLKILSDNCVILYTINLTKKGANTWSGPVTANGDCAGAADKGKQVQEISLTAVNTETLNATFMGNRSEARIVNSKIIISYAFLELTFTRK
ncbi:MAG: hypothetical protein JO053_12755 [Acidobacteria bacterium]|nr:hypothetical protein [Acidobacteriota bacterium]